MSNNTKLVKQLATLRQLMDQQDGIAATLAPVAKKINDLREKILNDFTESDMQSTTAAGLRVGRTVTTVPTITDKAAFFAYATKTKNWDLLAQSINTAAWKERMEAKVTVPGVEPFNRVGLRVNRVATP